MNKYLLLLHNEANSFSHVGGPNMEDVMQQYLAWSEKLVAAGQYVGANKLKQTGLQLRASASGIVTTDGPFAETKEMVGGYFIISAASYEEASKIASECPHLTFPNTRIEVRELDSLSA